MKAGGGGGGGGGRGEGTRCRVTLTAVTTYVCHNFVGFQFLQRSQMIEYFVGVPFSFNRPCSIT